MISNFSLTKSFIAIFAVVSISLSVASTSEAQTWYPTMPWFFAQGRCAENGLFNQIYGDPSWQMKLEADEIFVGQTIYIGTPGVDRRPATLCNDIVLDSWYTSSTYRTECYVCRYRNYSQFWVPYYGD